MAVSQANKVFHCIRTIALHQSDGMMDGNLLDLYIRQKSEVAFEALVRRHGRMVLGVCRRILGNCHDAEDAFQATFLVLVRKAAYIRPSGMVGNWLYGVAHRTALEARRSATKRQAKEARVAPRTETPEDALAHLRPLLDQELPRLPDKYRAVLVLCDLEGRTRKEAAQQLGLPDGTVASRLNRARIILAKRLTRHGVTLSGGALAAAMVQEAASAATLHSLVFTTVEAATAYAAGPAVAGTVISAPVAALTEGVLKSMLLSKLKSIVLFLVVIVGVAGIGWGNYRTWANDQAAVQGEQQQVAQGDVKQSEQQKKPVEANAAKADQEELQGTWHKASVIYNGHEVPAEAVKGFSLVITKDRITEKFGDKVLSQCAYKINSTNRPKWINQERENKTLRGIYDLKGDDLQICLDEETDNGERPTAFLSKPGTRIMLITFQRDQKAVQDGKKAFDEKKPPDQDQAKQVLDMVLKGFQAYEASKGKEGNRSARDLYVEVFLKAFQISSEMAKVKRKDQERTIAAIKELGGQVLIERATDSTSTIRVIFSETGVKDKDLEQLKGLPTLRELYLFRTQVTGEGLRHLKGLTSLQKLDLSHCTALTEAGLTNLQDLTRLQSLDLTATGVRDADLKHIKNLIDLQLLYLRFNPKITDAGLEELKGLTKLQTLVLDQAEISDAGLKHLKGLTKLRTLHLANAQLTDAALEQLKGLSELRSLSLMGTKVTDAGLVNLKGLTDLEELYLLGTKVTDAGLDDLKVLTKLRTLDLRLTKTTDRGVKSLKQALPKLKVVR